MKRIFTVIGTRPQYIKAVPVSLAIAANPNLEEFVVDTGQHFDFEMSGIFMRELGLRPPAVNLGVSSLSHARMTAKMLPLLEDLLVEQKPDIILIYGDTNSSLAAAVAAAKLDIPIAHVEGGIRTSIWNPEEINRAIVDSVSDWIFCPTREAYAQCLKEDLANEAHYAGDVMNDTLRLARALPSPSVDILESLGVRPREYVVATIHRPENTGSAERLGEVLDYIREHADGAPIILPAHPRVAGLIADQGIPTDGFTLCKPLGYLDMARLAGNARELFTDSGGLQKEAYFHDVPATVINDDTPWPVLRAAGRIRLWTDAGYAPRGPVDDFGDGHAAEKIVEILARA